MIRMYRMIGRRGNRLGLAVLGLTVVLCAALAGSAHAGHKVEREHRRTVAVTDHTAVTVSNPRGKTVIVGREGATEVVIIATKIAKAQDKEMAEEILARLHYEVREKDGIIVVRTVTDGMDDGRSLLSALLGRKQLACIDYAIEVPQSFSVETATTSGDVRVSNVRGPAAVSATSGAIELREIEGEVTVALTSGRIEARDVGGNLMVAASSGDVIVENVGGSFTMHATSGSARVLRVAGDTEIVLVSGSFELKGCLGDVTFRTSSGDAEIVDVGGNINAVTSSGDIDVMILPIEGKNFMLSSSSGNIGVFYLTPEDYGFFLDVSTASGSIEGDMDIKVDKISRRELRGVVGSGASKIMIETASGDVSIIERSSASVRGSKDKKK